MLPSSAACDRSLHVIPPVGQMLLLALRCSMHESTETSFYLLNSHLTKHKTAQTESKRSWVDKNEARIMFRYTGILYNRGDQSKGEDMHLLYCKTSIIVAYQVANQVANESRLLLQAARPRGIPLARPHDS